MKQVLLVCPEAPYPVLGGGAQRIASLIEYFADRNCAVDVLTFMDCQPPPGLVREVFCIPLPPNGRSLSARVLRNAGRLARGVPPLIDRLAGFDASIRAALGPRRYDLALLEHFWVAPYADLIRNYAERVWCDLHNIESRFFQTLAETAGPGEAWAHTRFSRLSERLEAELLPKFDGCLVCSEEDAGLVQDVRTVVYPNTIRWYEKVAAEKTESIVFSGNMDYFPNQQAVRWFHAQIWPKLRSRFPGLRWRLVGMHPEAVRPVVCGDPRVEITGAVEDAMAEIRKAQLAVVPLLAGSGTRIKILEAWAAGTAVVSTSRGAEGLMGSVRIADGADAFERAVAELLGDSGERKRLEDSGRASYEKRYHRKAGWSILDKEGPGRELE